MIPFVLGGAGLITAGILNILVNALGGWGSPFIMDGSTDYSGAIMV